MRVNPSNRAFTLFEVLAVIFLIALVFTLSLGFFSGSKGRMKEAARQLTQDIQGLYLKASQESKIYRIRFSETERQKYFLEEYQFPLQKPKDEENREAMQRWEDYQREIDALPPQERAKRTRMERGSFKIRKERNLSGDVFIEHFYSTRPSDEETKTHYLVFFPGSEMDQAAIVLANDGNLKTTLLADPLSGRVSQNPGSLSESEWKEKIEKGKIKPE